MTDLNTTYWELFCFLVDTTSDKTIQATYEHDTLEGARAEAERIVGLHAEVETVLIVRVEETCEEFVRGNSNENFCWPARILRFKR